MPTLDEFRNQSGDFAPESEQPTDAELEQEKPEVEEEPEVEDTDEQEAQKTPVDTSEEEDLTELPEAQKTAFQKRLEREQKKIREQAEKELSERYGNQYAKHQKIVEMLGGDPDKVEKMLESQRQQNELNQQAQSLAYQYGWDDEQVQAYVQQEQQKLDTQRQQDQLQKELQELRISNQINDLRDNPAYAGIKDMRNEITQLVSKANGTITVEQAYWALGGAKRAEQIALESEQRAAAKRAEQRRKPQADDGGAQSGEKPLDPEVESAAKRLGISAKEARELMAFDATNIHEARKKIRR